MSKELNLAILLGLIVFCAYVTHTLYLAQNSIRQRIVTLEIQYGHEKRLKAIEEKIK